jgi:hypothetical protein
VGVVVAADTGVEPDAVWSDLAIQDRQREQCLLRAGLGRAHVRHGGRVVEFGGWKSV